MTDLDLEQTRTPDPDPATGTRSRQARRTRRIVIWSGIAALAAVLAVALAGSLVYTERSSFCAACHEMRPYHAAWQVGPHSRSASCVDCHVDRGVMAHLAHKPVALKEVWDHVFRDNRFPNYTVDVPDSRCTGCHPKVPNKAGSLFSHADHAGRARCKSCHAQTGHVVTLSSLAAEDVLKANATGPPSPTGDVPSRIAGHIRVMCQDCHDQAKMKCSSCHEAPHESRGECSICHRPGTAFVFTHPEDANCASCHKAPADHFGPDCVKCHKVGKKFTFVHPADRDCAPCHKAPADHFGPDCADCHKVGKKFVFTHPSGRNCTACHTAPANHFGLDCAGCHAVGVPFANATFVHRGNTGRHSYRSFACVKCHPVGYTSASCTCHGGNPPD